MKKIFFLYLSLIVSNFIFGQNNLINDYFGNPVNEFNYYRKNCSQSLYAPLNTFTSQLSGITDSALYNYLSQYALGGNSLSALKYIQLGNTINSITTNCENEKYTTSFNANYSNYGFNISGYVFFRGNLTNTTSNFSITVNVINNDGTSAILPVFPTITPLSLDNIAKKSYSDIKVFKINYMVNLNQYVNFFKNPLIKLTLTNNDSSTTQVMSCFNINISKMGTKIVEPTIIDKRYCFNNSYVFGFPTIPSTGLNNIQATDVLSWGIKKYNNGQLITEETINYNPTNPSLSVNFSDEGFDAFKIVAKISKIINGVPNTLIIDETPLIPIMDCTLSNCRDCSSFDLIPNEKYLISSWVASDNINLASISEAAIEVKFIDQTQNEIGTTNTFYPSGKIIDGWQRIQGEFSVPADASNILIKLKNSSSDACYFDDIRVLPSKGNMKSFVYDQATQRLMAELDENNYATFYEYDLEGGLIRIKKETEKGVFTIQETRSSNSKN